MSLKPDGIDWKITEQIVEDLVTGITIQFEVIPNSNDPYRLRLFGNFAFGNREILFDKFGKKSGSGTFVGNGNENPCWLTKIEEL